MGGLGPVRVFANFSGALMLIPIALVVVSWFKMVREDKALEQICKQNPNA
jgi:BCCT family betaine/carnitine transporter